MILSLYSLKLEAAPTAVSVSHITEKTENLVMYFTALFCCQTQAQTVAIGLNICITTVVYFFIRGSRT